MQKFLVLFLAPAAGLEAWMKTDPEIRKVEEKKMMDEWDAWMGEHGTPFTLMAGTGKTKLVTKGSVVDSKNDLMLCAIIEAESHEAAADLFKDHPHFGIPDGTIEVMPLNPTPGME